MACEDFAFLNTRPAEQATGLQQAMDALGVKSFPCPTLQIRLYDFSCTNVPGGFDQVIVTSANALQSWAHGLQKMHADEAAECRAAVKTARWLAIGAKTRKAGQQLGIELNCLSREQFDSETLLADVSMQELKGQRILLLKGLGGRRKLAETLTDRGAQVIELDLYKRCQAPLCSASWQEFKQAPKPVILFSSVDSYLAMQTMLKEQASPWHGIFAAIVFSERIGEFIRQDGWPAAIEVVATQSDESVVETMFRLINQ
ncbi:MULTISPECIES: uroporphyrinogen-III synthase [Thiomicrorhabdus]|uniref:Uroporphyrinogen-III synthase n=1 Tax=Thiomicrorhabdus heinhorstiae TaxID=2748010 RepID=A0ABS0C111_9GAMM|nr:MULTISPECIES: uroporphyrinogen-III synthase [Thiomicrorhabdus]MBF6058970.1 uroporphyrinogen-III synthase [Thiomicrorhabdus heinhorstiae]